MISNKDQELIAAATRLLNEKYSPPIHSVAAALRTTSGKIITAVNIDHFNGFVCAEMSALDLAINQGEHGFESVVAVRKSDNDTTPTVANMCGKCRQIFHDYASKINIVVSRDGALDVKTIDELLPFSFVRQQKAQSVVIEKEKAEA